MTQPINPNISAIIGDIRQTYGLKPHAEESDINDNIVRETERLFKAKPIQMPVQHPLIIIASYLYNFIANKISSYFNQTRLQDESEIIFLANSLKNHGFISQKGFIEFKNSRNFDKESSIECLNKMIHTLYGEKKIDRRNWIYLTSLSSNGETKEVLQFLFALSSISYIHQFKEEMEEVISLKEQLQMLELMKSAYSSSSFTKENVKDLSTLTARLEIYRWLKEDAEQFPAKNALITALKGKDDKTFQKAILAYLASKIAKSTGLEKSYFKELSFSFDHMKIDNSFIHFSQGIETFAILSDWDNRVEELRLSLESMKELGVEEARHLKEDLKELYAIFGKILEHEKELSISPTVMGLKMGVLRNKWRSIGALIEKVLSKTDHCHHLCGCMFAKELQTSWPDVENTEIRASDPIYKPERGQTENPSKPNVLAFYCNWGNGHRSAMQAVAEYLGPEFHISNVDLPQTTLRPLDPIQKIAGGDHTITTLYNTLVAGKHWKWIKFLRGSGGSSDNVYDEKAKSLIREQVLKQRPDIIIVNYGVYAGYILSVAQELGIPFIRMHTDMDLTQDALDSLEHAKVKHFKKAIPYPLDDMIGYVDNLYDKDQYAVTGYPVRPSFYNYKKQAADKPEILQELKSKYNIQEDEVVYLISNGGCGSDNPFPQLLANTKKGEVPKGHVFVITGRNAQAKEELEKFLESEKKRLNADLTFHIKGFVNAQEMAEFQLLSTSKSKEGKRGLFIGKAGGASVAECLTMGTQMLLDLRENNELPWEAFTVDKLKEQNLASAITDEKDFISLVNDRCGQEDADYSLFRAQDPEKEIHDLVMGMIKEAKEDSQFMQKNSAWKTDTLFQQRLNPIRKPLNYYDSITSLNEMLKGINKPLVLNPDDAKLNLFYLINQIENGNRDKAFLDSASNYLDALQKEFGKSLDLGYSHCKKERFLMDIAYLDRLLVALQLPKTEDLASTLALYKTNLAKEQLTRFVNQKIAHKEDLLISESDACKTFVNHPDQFNWLMNLRIHRLAATFNHKLTLNEKGEVLILFNGNKRPTSELMKDSIHLVGDRIVEAKSDLEYTYHFREGLIPTTNDNHPDYWQNSLPLFKQKDRKTKDYRLEILSDTGFDPESGDQNHGWIHLKDPQGNVYSPGKFWDPDIDLPNIERISTLPGHIRSHDLHEFMPRKKGENIKTIKIDLKNEATFLKAKNFIEKYQKENRGFNLVNQNCVSFVKELSLELGIEIETQVIIAEYLLPIPLKYRKIFLVHPWMREATLFLLYPISFIANSILGLFGAFKKHSFGKENVHPLFYSLGSFLNPGSALIDSPLQLRVWQECLEEDQGKKIFTIQEVNNFSKKVHHMRLPQI